MNLLKQQKFNLTLEESKIPISDSVRGASETLGLDPLYVANEGRLVMMLPDKEVEHALAVLRRHEVSCAAVDIGQVYWPLACTNRQPRNLPHRNRHHTNPRSIEWRTVIPRIC